MKIEFPLLSAQDIECRIGQLSKDGSKASLLLYKTARTDAYYLDKVVGCMNWQCRFYDCKGYLFCSVGIYDNEKKEWIWKDDSGSAGNIEEEKSTASDSFKRACFKFGLGRELYSAPQIWVAINTKYDKFFVKTISYDEHNEIKTLEISNEKGELVYSYGLYKNLAKKPVETPKSPIADKCSDAQVNLISKLVENYSTEKHTHFFEYLEKKYGVGSISALSREQADEVIKILQGAK